MSAPDARGPAASTPKVIGLGAPISVWIYFEVCEIPALIDAIDDELGRYGAAPQRNGRPARRAADPEEWTDHIGELRRMRDDVQQAAATRSRGRFDVVWTTVLAHGVLHGAVRHAQRRAAAAAAGEADAATARRALAAAERSRHDLEAVDNGGRDAVWL